MAGRASAALPFLLGQSGCTGFVIKTDPETGLSLGYVAGDVTHDSAIVWLRAQPGSLVSLQYGKDPALSEFMSLAPISVESDSDYSARIKIERLEPATRYYYRAAVENSTGLICMESAEEDSDTTSAQIGYEHARKHFERLAEAARDPRLPDWLNAASP